METDSPSQNKRITNQTCQMNWNLMGDFIQVSHPHKLYYNCLVD